MGDFVEVENTHTTIPICVKKSKGNNCTRILYFVKMMHAKDEMTKDESSGDNFRPHNWEDSLKIAKNQTAINIEAQKNIEEEQKNNIGSKKPK